LQIIKTLSALTSSEDSCRRKFIENKKLTEELMTALRSGQEELKLAAVQCLVGLLRSDVMQKSLLLESTEFSKDL
jgi:hypothetical protein